MSQQTGGDQFTQQDPKQQFPQPDTQGKEIPAVGEATRKALRISTQTTV